MRSCLLIVAAALLASIAAGCGSSEVSEADKAALHAAIVEYYQAKDDKAKVGELTSVELSADRATVVAKLSWPEFAGRVATPFTFELQKEGGTWKVTSSRQAR